MDERKIRATKTRKVNRSLGGNIAMFTILALIGVFMAFPLVFIFNNAFKPLDEFFKIPPNVFVRNPTLENFETLSILMSNSWVPFGRYLFNTLLITSVGVVGHVVIASAAAYPLAKRKFPGDKLLFSMVVLSLMFSYNVTAVPNYIIISKLGINNTYLAVLLPAFAFGMGLFVMKQFMEQIPDSILESARLDGASEYKIFWSIVMPNVKPAWLTLGLLQFQFLWNTNGSGFLRNEELKPLNYALNQIVQGGVARAGAAGAVGLITVGVPVILFLLVQRNVIQTMATSGMKD
ncbi:MAG: multiple sugar transport system permease protein [Clostridiales bacterium]|jgi:ABC-type glycerol-3-phosphate transport system permease component|nr:ABC-type transporter, integral rane subunit [Oscillospiraceae bacterium]MDN5378016.1 multiple sugar transport system permease protein [Clostridiales bacterium]